MKCSLVKYFISMKYRQQVGSRRFERRHIRVLTEASTDVTEYFRGFLQTTFRKPSKCQTIQSSPAVPNPFTSKDHFSNHTQVADHQLIRNIAMP